MWLEGGGAQGGPRGQKEESSPTERAGPHDRAAVRGRDCRSPSLDFISLAGGLLSAVWSTHALRGKTPASQEPAQDPPASETRTSRAPASLLPDQSGCCRPERALGVGPALGNLVSPCPHLGCIPQSPTSPDTRASFQTLAGHSAGGGGKGQRASLSREPFVLWVGWARNWSKEVAATCPRASRSGSWAGGVWDRTETFGARMLWGWPRGLA